MYTRERKNNISKGVVFVLAMIITLSFMLPGIALASSEDLRDMDDTIDGQNNYLYEGIMERREGGPNDLDNIWNDSDKRNAEGANAQINMSSISRAVEVNTVRLSLWARKYIVPFTIVILLFNVFMLATTGVKNYSNRKKYIYGSIFLYIFFLIVLNFPLYILWRHSLGTEAPFTLDGFYLFVEGLTDFLKEQSFIISLIILSYGLVNYIGSETNLPKRMASTYAMKASVLLFVLFQIMPLILKLAV
jgi:hypothetical protein